MALVAVHTVVDIATNVRMTEIRRVPSAMAACALEHCVVTRIDVARSAHPIGIAVVHVEPRVVESGSQPTGGRVADCARSGEAGRDVTRIIGSLVVGFVTTIAIGRQRGVIVVQVTVRARHSGVRARQWERRVVVIEASRRPRGCVVTDVALLRETHGDMVRVVRALKISQMTTDTSRTGDVVIPVRMALAALDGAMRSGQRPAGRSVIEAGRSPGRGVVAYLALLRKSRRCVIGIGCAVVILQMARNARRTGQVEISTRVALVALQLGMPAGERESDSGVVETRGLPSCSSMALLASLRQSKRNVIRVVCLLEVGQVTAYAGCRCAFVPSSHMTSRAVQGRVHSGQGEPSELQVVKGCTQPGVDGVALLALDGESGGHVIRRVGLLVGVLMARVALDRQPLELSDRLAFVAVRAIQSGVSSYKRKAVLVLADSLQDEVPAFYCVALLAVCAHLAAVDVGVAVGAVGSGIREHRLGVTLGAGHTFMQAAQRVPRFVVIKFRNGAYGFPAYGGMAILAGNAQVAMGTARDCRTGCLAETGQCHSGQRKRQGDDLTYGRK